MRTEENKNGGKHSGGNIDRRQTSRFPVKEEVRYRLLHHPGPPVMGAGKTLDISSGGVLFTTSEKLIAGGLVELAMRWPARLDGTCPLQLVATGRVVRSNGSTAAVRIERYEFRTRSSASMAAGA